MENEDASLDEMHSKLNLYPFLIPRKKKREKNSFIFLFADVVFNSKMVCGSGWQGMLKNIHHNPNGMDGMVLVGLRRKTFQ